jgi:pimeloyl-ACP methyl ester carboxylesterase
VSVRPDRVRSFACGGGAVDADDVWHDVAQQWQTPGAGEAVMQSFTPEALLDALAGYGVPRPLAEQAAARVDDTMKDCILRLYRSAVHAGAEWQPDVERVRVPGLVLWGAHDPFAPPSWGERLARRVHGRFALLDCGHWWPAERPHEVAELLRDFWSGLEGQ